MRPQWDDDLTLLCSDAPSNKRAEIANRLERDFTALHEENKRLRRGLEWIAEHGEADGSEDLDEQAEAVGLDTDEFVRMAHDNLIVHAQQVLARCPEKTVLETKP